MSRTTRCPTCGNSFVRFLAGVKKEAMNQPLIAQGDKMKSQTSHQNTTAATQDLRGGGIPWAIMGLFVSLLGTLGAACQDPSPPTQTARLVQPVRVAVVWDRTVPSTLALRAEDVEMLMPLLRETGGELGISVPKDGADDPLLRVRIEQPPQQPEKTGDVFTDSEDQDQYERDLKAWQAETNRRIATFQEELKNALDGVPTDDPDVWPALRRAGMFLQEPESTWANPTDKWLVVISDRDRTTRMCRDIYGNRTVPPGSSFTSDDGVTYVCGQDGEWHRADALSPESEGNAIPGTVDSQPDAAYIGPVAASARLVVVRTGENLGLLEDYHPQRFESVQAAFSFVMGEAGDTR